jgi:dTDP-4-dehydrorhamnose reductase
VYRSEEPTKIRFRSHRYDIMLTLVTGASGSLGSYVLQESKKTRKVLALYNDNEPIINCEVLEKFNFLKDDISVLFNKYEISEVIHLAALSDPDECFLNDKLSYQLNVIATTRLAKKCNRLSIPFVYVSTDSVFGGDSAPYSEISTPRPRNTYGYHKLMAENEAKDIYPDTIICRIPRIYGRRIRNSILNDIFDHISNRKAISLFSDMIRTPINGYSAARGIIWAIENASGLIHMGGHESISWYEFGKIVADIIGGSEGDIKPCSMFDVNFRDQRPVDTSLNSAKAFGLGYQLPSIQRQLIEELEEI